MKVLSRVKMTIFEATNLEGMIKHCIYCMDLIQRMPLLLMEKGLWGEGSCQACLVLYNETICCSLFP